MESLKERIEALPQSDGKKDPHILRARKTYARSHMAWDAEGDEVLTELYCENFPISSLAKLLKRSYNAIELRIQSL